MKKLLNVSDALQVMSPLGDSLFNVFNCYRRILLIELLQLGEDVFVRVKLGAWSMVGSQ